MFVQAEVPDEAIVIVVPVSVIWESSKAPAVPFHLVKTLSVPVPVATAVPF